MYFLFQYFDIIGNDKSKVAKQNITYDAPTGKVCEELGCSGGGTGNGQNQGSIINTTNNPLNLDPSRQPVQPQACPTTSATTDYSSQYQNYQQAYSYGQVQSQYMGSFGGAYSTNQFNPYERYEKYNYFHNSSVIYYFRKTDKLSSLPNFFYYRTMYNAYTGPRAFLPHSAINLSVKTPAEVGSSTVQSSLDLSVPEGGSPYLLNPSGGGQVPTGYNSVPNANNVSSPQILDLTRGTGCAIPAIAATGSLIGALGGGGTAVSSSASVVNSSFNVAPSSIVPIVSTKNASSVEASTVGSAVINSPSSSSSKREQTEPMDFSSGQGMTFTNRNFDTSTFNRGASPGDLSRFRSSSKSNPHVISL